VARAVEQRDVKDGPVLSQGSGRRKASEEDGEIDAETEEMEDRLGPPRAPPGLGTWFLRSQSIEEPVRDVSASRRS